MRNKEGKMKWAEEDTLEDPESENGLPDMLATSSSIVALLALARRISEEAGRKYIRVDWSTKIDKGIRAMHLLTSLSISVRSFKNLTLESIRSNIFIVSIFINIFNPFSAIALNQLVQMRPLFQILIKLKQKRKTHQSIRLTKHKKRRETHN